MRNYTSFIGLGVLMLCSVMSVSAQTTVVLTPEKDNTIFQESGDESSGKGLGLFAGRTAASVQRTVSTVVENSAPNNARRALIKFDLSQIPSNAQISLVEIALVLSKAPNGNAHSMKFHRLLADWGEGNSAIGIGTGAGVQAESDDATWTHRFYNTTMTWSQNGGDYVSQASATQSVQEPPFAPGPPPRTTWSSQGLINDVQAWVEGIEDNFGWILIGDESGNLTAKRFYSNEDAGNIFRSPQPPRLTITYTIPGSEPAASALINETNVRHNWVELYNPTDAAIDLSSHSLCQQSTCDAIGSTAATILNGNSNIVPGAYTVIHWNSLNTTAGEIILQSSVGAIDTAEMVDYLQYGTANQANAVNAVAMGVWDNASTTVSISTDTTKSIALTFSDTYQSGEDTGAPQWTIENENPTLKNGAQTAAITLSDNIVSAQYVVNNNIEVTGRVVTNGQVSLQSSTEIILSNEAQVDNGGTLSATIITNN